MSVSSIDGLTMPAPGIAVLRAVMNQHLRLVVADYLALPGRTSDARLGVPVIVEALVARDPRAAVRVLRMPMIAGLIGAARRLPPHARDAYEGLVHVLELAILTELASRGDLERAHRVVARADVALRSTTGRCVMRVASGEAVTFGERSVTRDDGAPLVAEPAFFPVRDGILLATTDSNPLLSVQAHPEREGNAVDLGGRPVDEWVAALDAALAIVEAHAPNTYAEMKLALELVVPVGYHPERHFSVSYRDSVGAVYLTLHPNPMTLAEALIHEFQHNKLNAVFHFDAVLRNASAATFASPVRPDPRPLTGVLMAVHAFLPVAQLYASMKEAAHPLSRGHDFEKRFLAIVESNHEASTTLAEHALPTALGAGLLAEIARWDARFTSTSRDLRP